MRLADAVVRDLLERRQESANLPESGGILLGRVIDGSMDVVVDNISTPNTEDKKSRFRFFRAKQPAQRIVDDAWKKSSGALVYLGEWHSHPEPVPTPSPTDLENWLRISRTAKYETPFLLFVIVGTAQTRLWEILRGGSVAQLEMLPPTKDSIGR